MCGAGLWLKELLRVLWNVPPANNLRLSPTASLFRVPQHSAAMMARNVIAINAEGDVAILKKADADGGTKRHSTTSAALCAAFLRPTPARRHRRLQCHRQTSASSPP